MNASPPSLASAPMRALLATESRLLATELRRATGRFALSLEVPHLPALAVPLRSYARLCMTAGGDLAGDLRARADGLPFADASVDLIVVRHALEFAREPALLAGEITRVLASDGCLLVAGLQPCSLWLPWLWYRHREVAACLHPLSTPRLRRWLAAGRTQCCAVRRFGPNRPSAAVRDDAGAWPGAAYLLVARKRGQPPSVARIARARRVPVRGALPGPAQRECA